jgi:hypothetical protein
MGRRLKRSSCLRADTLYIHPFLELTVLREDQAPFGTFIPPRAATSLYDAAPSLFEAAHRCDQPAQARSGRFETVNLEFKCARAPDFERHWSLPGM